LAPRSPTWPPGAQNRPPRRHLLERLASLLHFLARGARADPGHGDRPLRLAPREPCPSCPQICACRLDGPFRTSVTFSSSLFLLQTALTPSLWPLSSWPAGPPLLPVDTTSASAAAIERRATDRYAPVAAGQPHWLSPPGPPPGPSDDSRSASALGRRARRGLVRWLSSSSDIETRKPAPRLPAARPGCGPPRCAAVMRQISMPARVSRTARNLVSAARYGNGPGGPGLLPFHRDGFFCLPPSPIEQPLQSLR